MSDFWSTSRSVGRYGLHQPKMLRKEQLNSEPCQPLGGTWMQDGGERERALPRLPLGMTPTAQLGDLPRFYPCRGLRNAGSGPTKVRAEGRSFETAQISLKKHYPGMHLQRFCLRCLPPPPLEAPPAPHATSRAGSQKSSETRAASSLNRTESRLRLCYTPWEKR